MSEEPKIDVIFPARTVRPAAAVYAISGAMGLWSLLLTGRWWLGWAQESLGHGILALILWPVSWFVLLLVLLQIILSLSSLTAKLLRQSDRICGPLACWYLVLIFSLLATLHLFLKSELDFKLGAAWFIGLAAAMAWRLVWRSKAGKRRFETS